MNFSNRSNLLSFALLFSFSLSGQNGTLPMPINIQEAYRTETRSRDGRPGFNYWQNTVDYDIQVKILPEEKMIEGQYEAVYYNNSPDELLQLVIRLYGDVYKKGNVRGESIDPRDIHDGVAITSLSINDSEFEIDNPLEVSRQGSNLIVNLREPLSAGQELRLETAWTQKIPAHTRERTGAYDTSTFFIAYFYPQIAVYDDIFGWDKLDYTLISEFYNNLANFRVDINVPEQYLVWATGQLQNPEEILPAATFERYERAKNSTDVVHIVTNEDLEKGYKTTGKSWKFSASDVTDFAFALSDHYVWDAAAQPVDNRNVLINSAYPGGEDSLYIGLTSMQQKAMRHFSDDVPGVPYPYPSFTTFISKWEAMEYPMMTNIGVPQDQIRTTVIHELFHTYLPMYVRINECRWAWMDEGWAEYVTPLVEEKYFKGSLLSGLDILSFYIPQEAFELPLITPSHMLTRIKYGAGSYAVPAGLLAMLYHHLGDVKFLASLRAYIQRWAQKSPTPYDFFNTFEDVSGEDLDWIWQPWFFEMGSVDLAIGNVSRRKVDIIYLGNRPIPVSVEIAYRNGKKSVFELGAEVWKEGLKITQIKIKNLRNIKYMHVNRKIIDDDRSNNFYPSIQAFTGEFSEREILGQYDIGNFLVQIVEKDGLLHYSVPLWGFDLILYPAAENKYKSLDDVMTISFTKDDTGNYIGADIHHVNYGMLYSIRKRE